jgi:quinol monooxygenase YgiN
MEWIGTASRRHAHIPAAAPTATGRAARIDHSLTAAAQALESLQQSTGCWWGDLTADTTLESDYVLYQLWRHQPEADGEWRPPAAPRIRKACASILRRQLPDGGWSIYPGGPSEVNATARAYTACKLAGQIAGIEPDSAPMHRARNRVIALGGLQTANSYTKINFSLVGLFPRRWAPSVPPEIVLAPGDILYEMSSWTRAILVPLSIVQAIGKPKVTPRGMSVDELLRPAAKLSLPKRDTAALLFHQVDRAVKLWEKRGLKNVRARAIREAERWMLERTHHTDGLGAIYPSMMYCIMALEALAPPDWLLAKEVRRKGDWSVKRPKRSRRAGISNSPTSFTPTSTTRPWCCWRWRTPRPGSSGQLPGVETRGAPSAGCSPCSRATAVGPPSTPTTTGNS